MNDLKHLTDQFYPSFVEIHVFSRLILQSLWDSLENQSLYQPRTNHLCKTVQGIYYQIIEF
jgi:hypothetical protein